MFENIHLTILYSALFYVFIIAGLRVLGKKELGQLSIADLVFIMLISEVVGDVMRASNDSLAGGIFAALTLMVVNKILEWWKYKSKNFGNLMEGSPAVLIRHGKMNEKEMKKNKITQADLEQEGRKNGIGDITTIALAILEVDGRISILKEDHVKTSITIEE
ncbi:MAG: DUF421 domain-containing protein [Bacteroidales bacterium]|nr:DUF421 domain-containing protein [Bacteroidales bacterium]